MNNIIFTKLFNDFDMTTIIEKAAGLNPKAQLMVDIRNSIYLIE